MKKLHYHIYNNGDVGMCNILMSLENALVIAKLTKRDSITFYLNRKINKSTKSIFDLYSIDFNIEIVESTTILETIPSLKYELHNSLFYYKETPHKDFVNGRENLLDLSEYEGLEEFRTLNNNTLSFYSYLFYLGEQRDSITNWIKSVLTPKEKYLTLSENISSKYCEINYNSLHLRRGDYLNVLGVRNTEISVTDFKEILHSNFDKSTQLVIHTDEVNKDYFIDIVNSYKVIFIDSLISLEHPSLDLVEVGLISLLVASKSNNFVGTMMSTFTSFIQRYRLYNKNSEDFRFLYPQNKSIRLDRFGRFEREPFSEYLWNCSYVPRELKDSSFWFREWESCYKQPYIKNSLEVFPNFLDEEEIEFILNKVGKDLQFFERENRGRLVLSCKSFPIISKLLVRSCEELNLTLSRKEIDNSFLQVFVQYNGGETFWHMDSLAPNQENDIRKRSILFYLNQEFQGSELSFPYLGLKLQPKKGTMLTYPLINQYLEMNREMSHSASILTKGTKIMCYFDIKKI